MSGFEKWKWFGWFSEMGVIFSLHKDSIFENLSILFEKVFERLESGLGFFVTWSRKMSKEIIIFGLKKKYY